MIIVRQEADDFEYVFWGSTVTEIYGEDISRRHLRSLGVGETVESVFFDFYSTVLDTCQRQFIYGDLDWVDREYRQWWMVMYPMSRNGTCRECVSWVYTDK